MAFRPQLLSSGRQSPATAIEELLQVLAQGRRWSSLARTAEALAIEEADLSQLSALLRGLSGTYDQASRAAAAS